MGPARDNPSSPMSWVIPSIKRHRIWFIAYFFFASIFYAEFKNTISRVGQVRELLGENEWIMMPR